MQRNESDVFRDNAAPCRAYGRLPNGIIRDDNLSLAAKVIAAVRVTFTGTYRTNESTQGRYVGRGLGKNIARAAIAELRRYGFFGSEQQLWATNRGHGNAKRFRETPEELTIPDRDYTVVYRSWFDGQLTLEQAGALIFIASGVAGPATFPDEVAAFLRTSARTAGKVLLRLEELGFIAASGRDPQGRFLRRAYHMVKGANNARNFAGVDKAGVHKTGDLLNLPLDERRPLTNTTNGVGLGLKSDSSKSSEDSELDMWEHPCLYGWLDDAAPELWETVLDYIHLDDDAVEAVAQVMNWSELRACIATATGGRHAPVIVSDEGLWAVVWLAAFIMEYFGVEISPVEALAIALNAIAQRIGRRPGAYLGSLKLIVDRVFWKRQHREFHDGYFFRDPQKPMFDVSEDGEAVLLIAEVQEG